ncbi:MAG TPA: phospho-N-acetylmuramoyl-pentapeptide-transferase, partial [Acidimicrobiales bacterium]|nr:phospho-N-acetylmuramoyl-pentapeptide-transferase [Acidimicrobiales bacterium]
MISLMASGGLALWVAGLGTPFLIHWLVNRRIGQQIRTDGPHMHQAKAGTPTMGGLAIVGAAVG